MTEETNPGFPDAWRHTGQVNINLPCRSASNPQFPSWHTVHCNVLEHPSFPSIAIPAELSFAGALAVLNDDGPRIEQCLALCVGLNAGHFAHLMAKGGLLECYDEVMAPNPKLVVLRNLMSQLRELFTAFTLTEEQRPANEEAQARMMALQALFLTCKAYDPDAFPEVGMFVPPTEGPLEVDAPPDPDDTPE